MLFSNTKGVVNNNGQRGGAGWNRGVWTTLENNLGCCKIVKGSHFELFYLKYAHLHNGGQTLFTRSRVGHDNCPPTQGGA